jgi:flagellar biosynthetic protein FliR
VDGATTIGIGEATLAAYLLALARTAGFVLITPPFNSRSIPARARVGVAVALALPLSGVIRTGAPALDSPTIILRAVVEAFTGVSLGFFVLLAVATIQSVGELLDLVGGFTMTAALDPLLMAQTSIMGRLHQLTAATVLFASDGHLMVLHGLARSVQAGPAAGLDRAGLAKAVTGDVAGLFLGAVQIAAPVIAAMLVADVALGLLTRAAPALNPFALGFPLKILFTLLLAGLVIARLPQALEHSVEHAVSTGLALVRQAVGGG